MPKISVIVPIYKVEKYLNRCVDSILNQTFKDFELILVDDGSPDNCPTICDEYAAQYDFIHVIHKENGGLSDARNAGIDWAFQNSDSEYISFIDSDDWVHKQYLELLYNVSVENDVEISACLYCDTDKFCENNIESSCELAVDSPEIILCKNLANVDIACAKIYKKNCFYINRFPIGKYYEDGYLIHKIVFSHRKIAVVRCCLYCYCYNSYSISNGEQSPKQIDNWLESDISKVQYYANNKFFNAMNYSIEKVKCTFLKMYTCYNTKKEYKDIIKNRKKELYKIIKNNFPRISDSTLKDTTNGFVV